MSNTANTFHLESNGDCFIVTLLPQLNQSPWAEIESVGSEIVANLRGAHSPKLLVDLTPLEYMGSAQVALIVRCFKTVKERKGTLIVINRHPVVHEVLALAGLNKLWTIVPSREEAFNRIGGGSIEMDAAPRDRGGFLVLGGIAAVISVVALASVFAGLKWVPIQLSLLVALCTATITFAFGLIVILNGTRGRRSAGVAVLIIGTGLLLGSVTTLALPPAQLSDLSAARGEDEEASEEDAVAVESDTSDLEAEVVAEEEPSSAKKPGAANATQILTKE